MSPVQLSLGLLAICMLKSASAQSWPSWVQVPFRSAPLNKFVEGASPEPPEALLLEQIRAVDAVREPEKAHALHTALANMLRADSTLSDQGMIQHLQAARDAAVRSEDADLILSARLALIGAYIDADRPQDADKELESQPLTNTLLSPDNFWEFSLKLDLARGRASFELGDTQMAVETYEQALAIARDPEDVVHLASDMARAHACLGHSQKSLKPLKDALEILATAGKADMLPAATQKSLAIELHTRLGQALHSMGDVAGATARYDKVSSLLPNPTSSTQQVASDIQTGIENLKNGKGPSLSCPGGLRQQKFQLPSMIDRGEGFKAKIATLLEAKEYRKAEFELWNHLETQARPYRSAEAVASLLTLGNLYQTGRKNYYKSAHCFRKALPASLLCCGAQSKEAKVAFDGLSYLQDVIPAKVRKQSAGVLQEYLDAVESTASATDLGDKVQLV